MSLCCPKFIIAPSDPIVRSSPIVASVPTVKVADMSTPKLASIFTVGAVKCISPSATRSK